jgi:hypothetical protein
MGSEFKESKKIIYDLSLFFVIEHVLRCYYTCYMAVHATFNYKLPVLFLPSNCAELTQILQSCFCCIGYLCGVTTYFDFMGQAIFVCPGKGISRYVAQDVKF